MRPVDIDDKLKAIIDKVVVVVVVFLNKQIQLVAVTDRLMSKISL